MKADALVRVMSLRVQNEFLLSENTIEHICDL
jgi:hypothetical protein